MTEDKEEKYNVKIVSRSLAIFDMAADREDPFTVQDVMKALQVNVNMAYRLLSTMTSAGYLLKNEATGTYTVSLKVLKLFNRALSSIDIRKFALPYMEMLAHRFPEANINLGVLYDGEVVQTDRIDGQVVLKTYFTPGKKIPFHASALGKALVSELYPEELERIIDKSGGLKEFTVHTITDYAVLQRELRKVREQGYAIDREELTLHVGAGTFKPVKSEEIESHSMHTEYVCIRRTTLEKLLQHNCEAIAVGTTSVRTLESLYYMGCKVKANPNVSLEQLHVNQWEPYDQMPTNITPTEAIGELIAYMDRNNLPSLHSSTQIIIAPGYQYKIVKRLVTNFHQPQSTLLLLVSAFVGGDWKSIYRYALDNDFRFLSYGDSSILIP